MFKVKLALAAGVVVCLVAAAVIGGATSADAVALRNPPPPGSGWVWGAPLASLPTDCNLAAESGGWDNGSQEHYSTGLPTASTFQPTRFYVRLAEPCYRAEQANGVRIRLGGEKYMMPTATTPVTAQASMDGAPGTAGIIAADWYLRCATSEWSTAATTRTHNGTGGFSATSPSAAESGTVRDLTSNPAGAAAWGTSITDANCPFLISATGKICSYFSDGSAPWGTDPATCKTITWWAEDWFANRSYGYQEWDEDLCTFDIAASSDCVYTLPDSIDGTDFAQACQGAPGFTAPGWDAFGDWIPDLVAWWQAAIGHYGRCLFAPVNGWDSEGLVSTAWETSSFTEAVALLEDATAAFTFSESCGVIVDYGTVDSFTGATGGVNTCEWSGWGGTVRTGIGIILTLGFAWWAIQFVVVTLTALFRAVPMIDPMTYADIIHNSPPPGGD